MPESGESIPTALLIRVCFTKPGLTHENNNYGEQIQHRAIKYINNNLKQTLQNEAWLNLSYSVIDGKFADGEAYQLQKPHYQLTKTCLWRITRACSAFPKVFSQRIW